MSLQSAPPQTLLKLRDVCIGFGSERGWTEVVSSVSLDLVEGRTLSLLGESGCGKSLTSLSILRLIDPPGRITSGSITLAGAQIGEPPIDLLQLPPQGRKLRQIRGGRIAMIFQEPAAAFTPVYTIGSQIVEAIQAHESVTHAEARARVLDLFSEVGIPEPARVFAAYPHQLSGGMCQRAMIALAVSGHPQLLIADEPTTALDVTIQKQVLDLLHRIRERYRTTILLITHDLGVVADMADDVAVMYLGRIVESGSVDQIFESPSHPYTIGLFGSIPSAAHRRGDLLPSIGGQVPETEAWPSGCRFRTRCAQEFARCKAVPSSVEVSPGHVVSCWLHGPADPSEEAS